MKDEAPQQKIPAFDPADIEDRVAAEMRKLRKANSGLGGQELLKKAFPE